MSIQSQLKTVEKKLKDIESKNPNVYIFRLPQDQEAYDKHVENKNDITIGIRAAVPNDYKSTT